MFTPINAISEAELKSAIVRNPPMVTQDTSVIEAIGQMSGLRAVCSVSQSTDSQQEELLIEERSSCVLVVENNQPVGIFTERDVVRLSAQKRNLDNLAIRDVMAYPLVTLRESDFTDLFFAVNLLQHYNIRHLPVVDDQNQLVGLLTHGSLRQTSRPVDLLRLRLVNEVMTRKVICAAADVSILAIARLMAENRVSSVMIVQTQESRQIPLGIVTERDIVQFQALKLNFETCPAQAVMSTPIFCVNADESLWTVQQMMEQRLIQRLAVTGTQGELLGIVTQSSILQVLSPLELYKLTEVLDKKVLQLEAEKIKLLKNRTVELEVEVDERTIALRKQVLREQLITKVASQIRSSLDLQDILNTTVVEIRSVLNCDRVIIYQFHPDLTGRVIAESIVTGGISVLHTEPQDPCITPEWLEPYRQGQIRVINDIHSEAMSECHQNMLIELDIRSKLMVPIIFKDQIWGLLLTSYHDTAHYWELEEIELVRQLSIQVAIAIQQANTYEQAQIEIRQRQQAERDLYNLVKESERLQERLALVLKGTNDGWWDWDILNNSIYYSSRSLSMLGYEDGELDSTSDIYAILMQPEELDRIYAIMNQVFSNKNIEFIELDFRIRHKQGHYIPIHSRSYIMRNETGQAVRVSGSNTDMTKLIDKEQELQATLDKLNHLNQDLENQVQERTQALQNSETKYRNLVESTTHVTWLCNTKAELIYLSPQFQELFGWEVEECYGKSFIPLIHPDDRLYMSEVSKELVKFGENLVSAEFRHLHQDGSYVWVASKASTIQDANGVVIGTQGVILDISDRKEAEKIIKQQADKEHLLIQTTQRIHQSLDLATIFNTATQEIRQLINADRVGIFKFDPDSNFNDGQFVSESVVAGFKSALETKIHDHCFGEKYAIYYQQGRMQIVDDIDNAGLSDCHHDILAQFQVRANLAVPLLHGDNLWGLLCINQCSEPRHWQDFEVELVQQIANQLAIAIQQSILYNQVQSELIIRKQAEDEISLQLQRLKIIQEITQQIRGNLDFNQILAPVTQKVQKLMQVERVIVFRLFPDGRSQIVEEVVSSGYVALKDRHWDDERWSKEILDCYWQGKPRIVPDVMKDIWTDCLVEYSLEGNIQSKIVAPILLELGENETGRWVNAPNNKLWGVLVVHACSRKRIWEESEAQLLQQIANQLAIAIQQAELFEQLQLSLVQEKEVSKMRARFISMASHEFRTPLAIISSSTGILQNFSDRLTTEKKHGHLEIIQKTIKHIVQLLDDVLMINRAEAEKMEFNPEALDIIGFCRHLKEEIETTTIKHTIEFSLNASKPILDDTLVVEFDQKLIRQILTNILSNAIKYSPENSIIYFSLTTENDKLIFKIRDSGIGIPEEDKVNLFASFYRASNVSNISGTGLGLAIVKKCVDLHKGEITLDSQINKGTTFTVSIPSLRLGQ
jgi:PAS domain S-box-containing protein